MTDPAAEQERWRKERERWQKRWDAAQRTKAIRSVPLPEGWKKAGTCRWCLEPIVAKRAKQMHWHPACKTEWLLHSHLDTQFRFLCERDGKRCAQCKDVSFRWLRGESYRMVQWAAGRRDIPDFQRELWPSPTSPWSERTEEDRNTGWQTPIRREHALQVDHRVPLWSVAHLPDDVRRPYFGPRNLWLLCSACHAAKTRTEAARRARLRKAGWPESVLHGNGTDELPSVPSSGV